MIVNSLRKIAETKRYVVLTKVRETVPATFWQNFLFPLVWHPDWELSFPVMTGELKEGYLDGLQNPVEFVILKKSEKNVELKEIKDSLISESPHYDLFKDELVFFESKKMEEEFIILRKVFKKIYVGGKPVDTYEEFKRTHIKARMPSTEDLCYNCSPYSFVGVSMTKNITDEFFEDEPEASMGLKYLLISKSGRVFFLLGKSFDIFVYTHEGIYPYDEAYELLDDEEFIAGYPEYIFASSLVPAYFVGMRKRGLIRRRRPLNKEVIINPALEAKIMVFSGNNSEERIENYQGYIKLHLEKSVLPILPHDMKIVGRPSPRPPYFLCLPRL